MSAEQKGTVTRDAKRREMQKRRARYRGRLGGVNEETAIDEEQLVVYERPCSECLTGCQKQVETGTSVPQP